MRTYSSTMNDILDFESEQQAILAKPRQSESDKDRLLTLEGQIRTLRDLATELHEAEVESLRTQMTEGGSGGVDKLVYSNLETGTTFRAYGSTETLSTNANPWLGEGLRAMLTGDWSRIPAEIKAVLTEGSDSAGGFMVPSRLADYTIDLARAQSRVIQAGAITVPMVPDGASLTIARVTADPAVSWVGENSQISPADPTFGAVVLTPKKAAVLCHASRELLEDAPNAGKVIESVLASAIATEIDRVCLEGAGTGAEPAGLSALDSSGNGIGEVFIDASGNSAVPSNTNYLKLAEAALAVRQANYEPTAIISSPRAHYLFRSLQDDVYQPLRLSYGLEELPWYTTSNCSDTLTCGTASGTTSNVYVGQWDKMLLGIRRSIQVYATPDFKLDYDTVSFLATVRMDMAVEDRAAFARLLGIAAS